MVNQFDEITLNRDDDVWPFIDSESLMMLESRAPMLSTADRSEISKVFKDGTLFPNLKDSNLRIKVEAAVCQQGLVLSFATLAKDLHVLSSKIHKPLKEMIKPMDNYHGDTVRRKVTACIADYPDPLRPQVNVGVRRDDVSHAVIYETLFVDLLCGMYEQISEADLSTIRARPKDIQNNNQYLVIPINDDAIRERQNIKDALGERHGIELFEKQSVKSSLHWRPDYKCSSVLRASSVARYLTFIFLFGKPEDTATSDIVSPRPLYERNQERLLFPTLQKINRGEGTLVSRELLVRSWRAQVESTSPYSRTSRSSWRTALHKTPPTRNASQPRGTRRTYRWSDPSSSAALASPKDRTGATAQDYIRIIDPYPYEQHAEAIRLPPGTSTNVSGQDIQYDLGSWHTQSLPDNSSVYSVLSSSLASLSGRTACNGSPRSQSSNRLSGATVFSQPGSPERIANHSHIPVGTKPTTSPTQVLQKGEAIAHPSAGSQAVKPGVVIIHLQHPGRIYEPGEAEQIWGFPNEASNIKNFLKNQTSFDENTKFLCPLSDGYRTETKTNVPALYVLEDFISMSTGPVIVRSELGLVASTVDIQARKGT
jgi:hypothetical protein